MNNILNATIAKLNAKIGNNALIGKNQVTPAKKVAIIEQISAGIVNSNVGKRLIKPLKSNKNKLIIVVVIKRLSPFYNIWNFFISFFYK